MARKRLPATQYPEPGHMTTPQVMDRLGLTFRQLKYAREETTLKGIFGEKSQRRTWPEDVVRRMEIAVALNRAIPKATVRHSGLPVLIQAVLDGPTPPEAGWVLYDGSITYTQWSAGQLEINEGGLVARIPPPWEYGERPQPDRGWAVVEER